METPNCPQGFVSVVGAPSDKELLQQERINHGIFAKQVADDLVQLIGRCDTLQRKAEEAFQDKVKFQALVDELEESKAVTEENHRKESAKKDEQISGLNEEVAACHLHIKGMQKTLVKKEKEVQRLQSNGSGDLTFRSSITSMLAEMVTQRSKDAAERRELEERMRVAYEQIRQLEVTNATLTERLRNVEMESVMGSESGSDTSMIPRPLAGEWESDGSSEFDDSAETEDSDEDSDEESESSYEDGSDDSDNDEEPH